MTSLLENRIHSALEERRTAGTLRALSPRSADDDSLNLADNDTLDLARDPSVIEAACAANRRWGCSSSASPLITGYTDAHNALERTLCEWHGAPSCLVWNSGFTANQAVLGRLPAKGDLVLADRLIHNSMISGILGSGARLRRFRHNDLSGLEALLKNEASGGRSVFVVTETVYSMDGDYPDPARMAALKKRNPFFWVVDEAHATGWFGKTGAGLLEESGTSSHADVIVGTLGKALGSQGAYTLFRNERIRDYLINVAGEFIYSTYLPPACAAAASTAVERCRELAASRHEWRTASSMFRRQLAADGWNVPDGDSPIVPVLAGDPGRTMSIAASLARSGILVGAVRPPTVPPDTSRLRISLKRSLSDPDYARIRAALARASESDSRIQ